MSENNGDNKDILILYSNKEQLFKKLVRWAAQTNSTIICNPSDMRYDGLMNLFAIVIDSDMIETLPIPETVCERVIPAELSENLILKILDGLKPGTDERIKNVSGNTDNYQIS